MNNEKRKYVKAFNILSVIMYILKWILYILNNEMGLIPNDYDTRQWIIVENTYYLMVFKRFSVKIKGHKLLNISIESL